jgi:biopolymer transport protein ExbD
MRSDFTVSRPRQRLRPIAEMNVTSLVDVVLVLLIIFMLTAPFIQGGIEVDLPTARTPATAAVEGPVISLDTQRRIFIDEDQVPMARLAEVLQEIRPAGSGTPVYLRSDGDVPYGFVVRVMGEIKEGGVEDLSLVVEPESRDAP